ncbi:hypothetical protein ABFA25_13500 [Mycobacterium lepromatosis]|uniref:hypothetical protein n=1 Tax=Mycobacterium lepromatosis TaxID=480418 RepID=UPI003D80723D
MLNPPAVVVWNVDRRYWEDLANRAVSTVLGRCSRQEARSGGRVLVLSSSARPSGIGHAMLQRLVGGYLRGHPGTVGWIGCRNVY